MSAARYEPRDGKSILFTRGTGGDEAFRIHRFDPAARQSTPLSPEGMRAKPIELSATTDFRIGAVVPWVKVEKYLERAKPLFAGLRKTAD